MKIYLSTTPAGQAIRALVQCNQTRLMVSYHYIMEGNEPARKTLRLIGLDLGPAKEKVRRGRK